MLKNLARRLISTRANAPSGQSSGISDRAIDDLSVRLEVLNEDPYLYLVNEPLRLISVFDDLKYDRADMDLLSGPMRNWVLSKLTPLGFQQTSGGVVTHRWYEIRMHIPKFRALGASPFDATRDTPRSARDYYILTPTQTACQFIQEFTTEAAVEAVKELVCKQPVNLLRISDYLDKSDRHQAFKGAIGHLKYVQREAVQSEPL
ncbi:MAG: hypothetical protein AAF439_15265, partial [Pseudomonadota bacterium]